MPAAVTSARQNSSASWGSNGGDAERRRVGGEGHVVGEIGPARDVEGHLHERLVERKGDRGEAADAGLVAERGGQGLAQDDADVLHRVVGVDVEVTAGPHGEGQPAVPAELGQHVVEEGQAGLHLHRAGVPPGPAPSRSSSTSMAVSAVRRWRLDRRSRASLIRPG